MHLGVKLVTFSQHTQDRLTDTHRPANLEYCWHTEKPDHSPRKTQSKEHPCRIIIIFKIKSSQGETDRERARSFPCERCGDQGRQQDVYSIATTERDGASSTEERLNRFQLTTDQKYVTNGRMGLSRKYTREAS